MYSALSPYRPRSSKSFWFYGIISLIKAWKNDKFGCRSSKLRVWYKKMQYAVILTILNPLLKVKKGLIFRRQFFSLPAQQAKHIMRAAPPFLSVLRKSKHSACRFPTTIRHYSRSWESVGSDNGRQFQQCWCSSTFYVSKFIIDSWLGWVITHMH